MTTLGIERHYNFANKDPAIDKLRTKIVDEGGGRKLEVLLIELAERCKGRITIGTLRKWFLGDTKRPQHAKLAEVGSMLGYDWVLVKRKPKK